MTGKDLVLFIVKHDLLDVEINQNIDEIFNMQDSDEQRVAYIQSNPSALLKIDDQELKRIQNLPHSSKEYRLFEVLKATALSVRNSGFLIFGFINNGFNITRANIDMALLSQPSICAQCPKEWFNSKTIRGKEE